MQATLCDTEIILRNIIEVYNTMDERDVVTWSREEAEKVVADQILMDKQHGLDPLPYDEEDFYDTIRCMILMDYGRLHLFFLRLKQMFRR